MANYAYPVKELGKYTKPIIKAVFILLAIILLFNILKFFVVVNAGERGVLLQFGHVQAVYEPGLHFQIPLVHKVIIYDVRTQKGEVQVGSASKDLQLIKGTVALNYHVDPKNVGVLHSEIGTQYEQRIISPAIQESVKAATAQFTAEELITKRPLVKENIRTNLIDRLSPYNIIIDEFSIVDFSFSAEFDRAIEAKQTAEQNALKAQNDLKRIEIEAQQKIETAKAEAESIRIQAEALKENRDLIQLKFVEKWNGTLPNYMLGDSIPLLNLPAS